MTQKPSPRESPTEKTRHKKEPGFFSRKHVEHDENGDHDHDDFYDVGDIEIGRGPRPRGTDGKVLPWRFFEIVWVGRYYFIRLVDLPLTFRCCQLDVVVDREIL